MFFGPDNLTPPQKERNRDTLVDTADDAPPPYRASVSASTLLVRFPSATVAQPFPRTTRSLRNDGGTRSTITLVVLGLLGAGWGAWLVLGVVTLHAVSYSSRLEAEREAHPVDAPVAGVVAATALQLDRTVERGEVLIELDGADGRLSLEAARAERDGLESSLLATRLELRLAEQLSGEERHAAGGRLAEARARNSEAEADARAAAAERARARWLFEGAAISAADWDRAQSAAEQRLARANAARAAVGRASWDARSRDTERRGREERLRRDLAENEGELRAAQARIAELEHDLALRRIAAPIGGRLGEVAPLRLGQFVKQGERLAAVVPDGHVRIVAEFDPEDALGKIVRGATARMRLDGFPWTQYGSVAARVQSVGREIRDGRVRVELTLDGPVPARVPIQHGLPGTVEVDVERASPIKLLLRLAGQAAGARKP